MGGWGSIKTPIGDLDFPDFPVKYNLTRFCVFFGGFESFAVQLYKVGPKQLRLSYNPYK